MKKIFVIVFLFLFFGCVHQNSFGKEEFLVMRVVDGDTVELFGGETLRLIGIDTPERGEPCFNEAKQKLAELVEGKTVFIEKDVEEKDKYGRLLGYLYVGDAFVNLEMVESGFAFSFEYGLSTRYSKEFFFAEENAKLLKEGCLWSD